VANSLGVLDAQAPLVAGAARDPASPYRFRGSTLIDWMRSADPRSRALSVSRKDRGAILPIGRAHQLAIWYAADGVFTTSRYYGDTLPTWLTAFNALRIPQRFAGQSWTPALAPANYPEPDSVPRENGGKDFLFPHAFPTDAAGAAKELARYPQMDQVTLEAALAGLRGLGRSRRYAGCGHEARLRDSTVRQGRPSCAGRRAGRQLSHAEPVGYRP
jgi:hypothetical protein